VLARELFSGIAATYDWPPQLMSYGQYRRWHRLLLAQLRLPTPALVLDMATGTGALALPLTRRPGVRVIAADITRPMLLEAQRRARRQTLPLDLVECTAEAPPFAPAVFDAVIFTYLLRYVNDVPAVLRALARLVRPGGVMASLDFAVPRQPFYWPWRLHTDLLMPALGRLISPAWHRVGRFLGESIRRFYERWPEERLLALWRENGFADVRARRLSLGGALLVWGSKGPP
jgi:demethylmenaquinone methyltransferase/2-methoxy-6-polyprenyl-1,4-benzoquinol methylase